MCGILKCAILPVSAVLLMAAQPSWKTKDMAQWTGTDAKLLLKSSPWVGKATPILLPLRNEASRRDGGRMGTGQAVGLAALYPGSLFGAGNQPTRHGARPSLTRPLEIRWESAAPVRAAEAKSGEEDAPEVSSEAYSIAVYDVPGLDPTQKTLPGELREDAFLKSDGRMDRRPIRVDVLPQENGLTTVVYSFQRADEILLSEKRVTFTAILGRLSLAQYFNLEQMQIQGKLQL